MLLEIVAEAIMARMAPRPLLINMNVATKMCSDGTEPLTEPKEDG
jgi:hypothetical protein